MNKTTIDFIRYLSKQDKKTLSQKALKTCEEVGTLAKVVLPYDNAPGTQHRFVERQAILEEAVDVILCALSTAYHLDFTDDEVADMMNVKVEKWAGLQQNEKDVVYPLPYEIHITVNIPVEDIERFRNYCVDIVKVKPIVLELQNKQGNVVIDVMTSSKHYGDNRSVYEESERIANLLKSNDFVVTRVKIETVPWHPAAPSWPHHKMPKDCYFECHIPLILHPEYDPQKILTDFEGMLLGLDNVHVSKNVFKRTVDGCPVVMATVRSYDTYLDQFKDEIESVMSDLSMMICSGIQIGKHIIEFSIYDTKVSHDFIWMQ